MMDHPKVYRAVFVNQTKEAHLEVTPRNTSSFFNGKWPIHEPSGDFLIIEICDIFRLNLGRRNIIGNESKIDRRQSAYRVTEGEIMNEIRVRVYKIHVGEGLIPCS